MDKLCRLYKIQVHDKYYTYESATVTAKPRKHKLWEMPIQSDKEIKSNRPGKTCLLISMSIPMERNTSLKIVEKLSEYKDLEIGIEKAWEWKQQLLQWSLVLLGLSKGEQ